MFGALREKFSGNNFRDVVIRTLASIRSTNSSVRCEHLTATYNNNQANATWSVEVIVKSKDRRTLEIGLRFRCELSIRHRFVFLVALVLLFSCSPDI